LWPPYRAIGLLRRGADADTEAIPGLHSKNLHDLVCCYLTTISYAAISAIRIVASAKKLSLKWGGLILIF
jgi:hypothetical protein